jgi:hypothetical protein
MEKIQPTIGIENIKTVQPIKNIQTSNGTEESTFPPYVGVVFINTDNNSVYVYMDYQLRGIVSPQSFANLYAGPIWTGAFSKIHPRGPFGWPLPVGPSMMENARLIQVGSTIFIEDIQEGSKVVRPFYSLSQMNALKLDLSKIVPMDTIPHPVGTLVESGNSVVLPTIPPPPAITGYSDKPAEPSLIGTGFYVLHDTGATLQTYIGWERLFHSHATESAPVIVTHSINIGSSASESVKTTIGAELSAGPSFASISASVQRTTSETWTFTKGTTESYTFKNQPSTGQATCGWWRKTKWIVVTKCGIGTIIKQDEDEIWVNSFPVNATPEHKIERELKLKS